MANRPFMTTTGLAAVLGLVAVGLTACSPAAKNEIPSSAPKPSASPSVVPSPAITTALAPNAGQYLMTFTCKTSAGKTVKISTTRDVKTTVNLQCPPDMTNMSAVTIVNNPEYKPAQATPTPTPSAIPATEQ